MLNEQDVSQSFPFSADDHRGFAFTGDFASCSLAIGGEQLSNPKFMRFLEQLPQARQSLPAPRPRRPLRVRRWRIVVVSSDVYGYRVMMLERLSGRKSRLDQKVRQIQVWRKISSMIFVTKSKYLFITIQKKAHVEFSHKIP